MSEAEVQENKRHFSLPGVPKGHLNTKEDVLLDHIRTNITRHIPQVHLGAVVDRKVAIVCGGPSLAWTLDEIRAIKFSNGLIWACNNAGNFLLEHGIKPDAVVMMDARPFNARFVEKPIPDCAYLLASQCHPDIFDICEGRNTWIFHADLNAGGESNERKILDDYYGKGRWVCIEGGSTIGLRAIMLARVLGYINLHIFGFDGCVMDGIHHAYPQPENDGEVTTDFTVFGKTFQLTGWQIKQYEDFINVLEFRGHLFRLTIHGGGLFEFICKKSHSFPIKLKQHCAKMLSCVIGTRRTRKVFGLENQEDSQDGRSTMEVLR